MAAGERCRSFEDVYVAGYGETPFHKRQPWSPMRYLADAARRTVAAAGVDRTRVDGLGIASFGLAPGNVCTVAEHLGLRLRWTMEGAQGGASWVVQVLRAAEAVERRVCDAVLVIAGDAYSVDSHMALMGSFNPPVRDYLAPYGFGGANGLFAMVQRRHMHRYGTTEQQMGKIAVTQREHAAANPNALLREPLTMAEYLDARMIAEPLRLYDCVLPCGGGGGVLVGHRSILDSGEAPFVRLVAGAECTKHSAHDPVMVEGGWSDFGRDLLATADVAHDDLGFVQLYDDYPIIVALQLEDLGFCDKGEAGRFVEATDLSITGELPLNTGGGQLSCGQAGAAGGMLGLVEGVRQLQGQGARRQVAGARTGLVSGFGMVGYGHGLTTAAVVLKRRERL